MPPDAITVRDFLRRSVRRLLLLRALEGATGGILLTSLIVVMRDDLQGWASVWIGTALAVVLAAVRTVLGEGHGAGWWRDAAGVAGRVERRAPQCRNLLFTAAELTAHHRAAGEPEARVCQAAARIVSTIDPARLFPWKRQGAALVASVLVLVLAGLFTPRLVSGERQLSRLRQPAELEIETVDVAIVPPPYLGLATTSENDPERLEVVEGSRLTVTVRAPLATRLELESLAGRRELLESNGMWRADLVAASDDYLALVAHDSTPEGVARRLIGLTVIPDQPPRVSITSPGRDLFLAAVPETLRINIEAADDHALGALRLSYTTITGGGEQFSFSEQELPVDVARRDEGHWTATTLWPLSRLGLTPGDMLVYRAIASDGRPDRPPVTSESWVIEVVSTGAVAADGFAAADEERRYAVSQQMVILRTERLMAARSSMTADSVLEESRMIAAEQRQVRAEFVFMMGGELEDHGEELSGTQEVDETAEAEAEGDVLAGRLQNRGRIELMRALRSMSQASAHLNVASLDSALTRERMALDNLMKAFSRSRYLLRALTRREHLDLTRRLTGDLADARSMRLPSADPQPDPRISGIRAVLSRLASLSARERFDATAAAAANSDALELLRLNPSDDSLQSMSRNLQETAAVMTTQTANEVRRRLEEIALSLGRLVRTRLPEAPVGGNLDRQELRGALLDVLGARGRQPR